MTARMSTRDSLPAEAVALNRDGTIQRNNARDPAREKIRRLKAKFNRAKIMLNEALEIMGEVEEEFLNLEKTDFQDLLEKNN